MPFFAKPAPSKWDDAQKWIPVTTSIRQGKQMRMMGFMGGRQHAPPAKVVFEIMGDSVTKRIDLNQARKEIGGQKEMTCVPESSSAVDLSMDPTPSFGDSALDSAVSLTHDVTSSSHSTSTFVSPPTVKSVSMRDMGTEMTPLASQEQSRTGTPIRATSPSRSPIESAELNGNKRLSEKELRIKTRKEIMALGTQLGKMNIAAWASKEEDEETDASTYLKAVPLDNQRAKEVIESRAAAWEEAEKAKYLARFKQEEIKIQAWENHQKAKMEAEMKKIEVAVERMRTRAHEKLMNKLAASRLKAEEKLAAAEARRNQQAARTAEQAENIRKTGRLPRSFSSWCF
ncbi:Uncharacterized protein AXF42_Ash015876 [Apostasia shenzhenica]|uniref:Remorin C-terminal domain-containing protein n=1 Tax=Apostasia shenzhenica TaxID=1088818 RepID=A0A2H9ZXV6_9ASPA|nr:Uncharacterized protein AXF42_Ash015876 [Apostasia shenzhenica]